MKIPPQTKASSSLAASALALFLLAFFACEEPCNCPNPAAMANCKPLMLENKDKQAICSPFDANSVIFHYSETSNSVWVDSMRQYLAGNGFVLEDSCDCDARMELWTYNGASPTVDLIGVIEGSKSTTTTIGEGLFLNFEVNFHPVQDTGRKPDNPKRDSAYKPPIAGTVKSGSQVIVAVIDAGVHPYDAFLTNYLWPTAPTASCAGSPTLFGVDVTNPGAPPLDNNGHGTHVCGLLCGYANFPEPGKNPDINVVNIRFTEGNSGKGSLFKAVCGMYYAINEAKARIINVSWGYRDTIGPTLMEPLLKKANDMKVLVVAGLGNDTMNLDGKVKFWPACYAERFDNVISVGALNEAGDKMAGFSNWSSDQQCMNVVTLGEQLLTTHPPYLPVDGNIVSNIRANGTSMATPLVARKAAIIYSGNPLVQPGEVKALIMGPPPQTLVAPDGSNVLVRVLQ
ncbi:MAG: S8 family serine peptidase [Saprospiraceae bacterium]|nr:S8 family serine peptidase [Saprospiraceae bacterium]